MKKCHKCLVEKDLDDFPKNVRGVQGRGSYCYPCQADYMRERRAKKLPKDREKHRLRRAAATERNQLYVWEHLVQNPCVDCGETDPVVLQHDHVRGEKVADVSTMVSGGWALSTLQAEIEKCDVRCANDHIRATAGRAGWVKMTRFPIRL